jgi:hypothetical protein
MKDCPPTMKKYAIYERYLVKFFSDGFYSLYFVQELTLIKLNNWNEEISSYTKKVSSLANSLALSGMASPELTQSTFPNVYCVHTLHVSW